VPKTKVEDLKAVKIIGDQKKALAEENID